MNLFSLKINCILLIFKISNLISENLITKENNQIKLTDKGKLLGNEVFINFL